MIGSKLKAEPEKNNQLNILLKLLRNMLISRLGVEWRCAGMAKNTLLRYCEKIHILMHL